MKVKIKNEQYRRLINESIKESICLMEADKYVTDKYITDFGKGLETAINDKLSTDKRLQQKADEIGINPKFSKKGRMSQLNKNLEPDTGNISGSMTDKVKFVVNILRGVTNSTGGINFNILKNNAEKGEYQNLSYADILRVKDFIDSMSLRFLYDPSINPASKVTFNEGETSKPFRFGIVINIDGTYDDSEFNLNTINNTHFNDWYKSRKNTVPIAKSRIEMKEHIVSKYLQSVYGMQFGVPNFSLGNEKVKDALMINFTSAYRCPAWNECLVKHACYARNNETQYYHTTKVSNDKKNLMWEACEGDPKLLKMVYDLLKAYVVDWDKVAKKLKTVKIKKIRGIKKVTTMRFSEMPEELINVIKECKRVSYIRLNENGDFINQNLLNSFDELAGDFKLIGVSTAAYSCRTLKFDKIKNIIINASRMEMEGPTIARYFYAIPKDMYDAFEDTYTSREMDNSFDSIGKTPLPLFSIDKNGNKQFNGSYYYKCPCSREDFSLVNTKNGKVSENQKVNCYQCHLCYEPNDEAIKAKLQNGGKYFVFVKAHGTHANVLNKKRELEIIRKVGVPENYQVRMEEARYARATIGEGKSLINENKSENEAYDEIAKNAIYSMTEHFKERGINESRTNFFSEAFDKLSERY